MNESPPVEEPLELATSLERWVAEGYITREQADRITAEEAVPGRRRAPAAVAPARAPVAPVAARPTSFVTEALGYVGGILILAAISIIAAIYWDDLAVGVRLGLAGGAVLFLLACGWALPEPLGPATTRLRAVLWLLSTGACALFLTVLGADVFSWQGEDVALLTAAGTAAFAAALWVRDPHEVQHVAFFVPLAVTVSILAGRLPSGDAVTAGLAVWGLSAVWMTLGWGGLIAPRRLALVLGGVGTLIGSQMAMTADWGNLLALVTVVGLVAIAVLFHDLLLLGVGAFGALESLPRITARFFPGALGPPLALLVVGVIVLAAALRTARRPQPASSARARRDYTTGAPSVALAAAAVIAVAVTATVVAIGLS